MKFAFKDFLNFCLKITRIYIPEKHKFIHRLFRKKKECSQTYFRLLNSLISHTQQKILSQNFNSNNNNKNLSNSLFFNLYF